MDCAIIGGGIGGLTTAIALAAKGIDAHVFEAAPALHEVGAGIWMPANALQVLDRLGLADAVRAAGHELHRAEVHDHDDGLLQAVDMQAIARQFGFATVAIHRARLQQILASHLPAGSIHTGRRLLRLDQDADRVTLHFDGGDVVSAAVVIGADGLRSTVRSQLSGNTAIRYSGQTSWRGVAQCALPEGLAATGREIWSAGRRFGFSAIAPDEVYWFAVMDAAPGGRDEAGSLLQRLGSLYATFADPVPHLLARTRADAITRTDISDLKPLRTWHARRIALVGDAAHATTPNLGQGGAQAIEDAWVIADRLAANPGDPARAFREYESVRRAKALRIVRTSWWLGRMAHARSRTGRGVRNILLRHTPQAATDRQFRSLFELAY